MGEWKIPSLQDALPGLMVALAAAPPGAMLDYKQELHSLLSLLSVRLRHTFHAQPTRQALSAVFSVSLPYDKEYCDKWNTVIKTIAANPVAAPFLCAPSGPEGSIWPREVLRTQRRDSLLAIPGMGLDREAEAWVCVKALGDSALCHPFSALCLTDTEPTTLLRLASLVGGSGAAVVGGMVLCGLRPPSKALETSPPPFLLPSYMSEGKHMRVEGVEDGTLVRVGVRVGFRPEGSVLVIHPGTQRGVVVTSGAQPIDDGEEGERRRLASQINLGRHVLPDSAHPPSGDAALPSRLVMEAVPVTEPLDVAKEVMCRDSVSGGRPNPLPIPIGSQPPRVAIISPSPSPEPMAAPVVVAKAAPEAEAETTVLTQEDETVMDETVMDETVIDASELTEMPSLYEGESVLSGKRPRHRTPEEKAQREREKAERRARRKAEKKARKRAREGESVGTPAKRVK
ncbi:hypothetical protein KIPB_000850 [Kipferlia bialata]|uniref:Uncharacterized protein n=1 Tax=Kipferlia bialata TaxID=797122 RepID=A0A9K3CR66_9EUKA|nr:hypothetical protein KIPB_000850 [Kipferlia bialata]|eukprot:g850.t1